MPDCDPFPPGTEQAFTFINQAAVETRYQFGYVKRAEYRHWLLHPKDKVRGTTKADRQHQYNQKKPGAIAFRIAKRAALEEGYS